MMSDIRKTMFVAGYEIALCLDDEVDALEAWRQYVEDGELDVVLDREREEANMIELDHTTSTEPGHTCVNSPHVITMAFDMTDVTGRYEYELARLGSALYDVLSDLDEEMRNCVKHEAPPCDPDGMMLDEVRQEGILDATRHWRKRIAELREENDVPTDVG